VNDQVWDAHVTRLSFYSTERMHVTGDLLDLISIMGGEYEIADLTELVWDEAAGEYSIRVRWAGFSELEDTYEKLQDLVSQVPKLVVQFLHKETTRNSPGFEEFLRRTREMLEPVCRSQGLELPQAIRK